MARKSNKTAHVLNLLAGHDAKKENPEETDASEVAETPAAETVDSPLEPPAQAAETSVPIQNIAVIDKTEKDPVAELIQNKLEDEFGKQLADIELPEEPAEAVESAAPAAVESAPQPAAQETPVAEPKLEPQPTAQETPVPETIPEPQPTAQAAPVPETIPEPQPTAQAAPVAEPIPEPEVQPQPEPEPDFVVVNVMERIVREKIIYFMREFDVCTCDRCVADTVALTLNGLAPKYIVTDPMAVDPLMNFYTNKYISEITVEATKACMTIKENPRH